MKLMLLLVCVLQISTGVLGCINMWDSNFGDKDICQVNTTSGKPCMFPFTFNNQVFYTCVTSSPYNYNRQPTCMTSSTTWSNCIVPTDAVISYVTTRKGGSTGQNGASVNGETLVWIYGLRFAKNSISMTPSTTTSNRVFLENSYASYECKIHLDKTTENQITCWTPDSMTPGIYTVKVFVNNNLIPYYQYFKSDDADINVNYGSTPLLYSISPVRGIPQSFVKINGDFNTDCYGRDVDVCASDSGSRITRVYFGPQLCDLLDQDTLNLYDNLTSTSLTCRLKGSTIGIFNVSMIVSEDNGRSDEEDTMYYVTPGELLYNFQTYAEITNITPNDGSTMGSTTVTISGKFLYHSDTIPSVIDLSGSLCNVISFDNNDELNSKIVCETQPSQPLQTEYSGNRGVTLIRDNVLTTYNNLSIAKPSNKSQTLWLEDASYRDINSTDVTIWLNGFIVPGKSSDYLFSIKTNGIAQMYLSTNASSTGKVLVSFFNGTGTPTNSIKTLQANTMYYFQVIASRKGGYLSLDVNARMFNASLTGTISSRIKTEIQEIEISSNIVYETIDITYNPVDISNQSPFGVAEIQNIEIIQKNSDFFVLGFDGAITVPLRYGSYATDVRDALNDLPTLETEGVNVTSQSTANSIIYIVQFTANRGDVPLITEVSRNPIANITEVVKGIATYAKFQLSVLNTWSKLFDLVNDPVANIKESIEEIFRVKCPLSIQMGSKQTTFAIFDYETECQFNEQDISLTAYCGKCSRRNNIQLFSNLNAPLTYNYLCFAYKITTPIWYIKMSIMIDGDPTNLKDGYANKATKGDGNWYYTCIELYESILSSWGSNSALYPKTKLTLLSASVYPGGQNMYYDVVSLRNEPPLGFENSSAISLRRIRPALQIVYNTLSVIRNTTRNTVRISYRPNNCTNNLPKSSLRQVKSNGPAISSVTIASPPVRGTFNIQWNGRNITGVSSNITETQLQNLLQSLEGMGNVKVTRSKDCSGYLWRIEWFDAGNKVPIIIPFNNLTGTNISTAVRTIVDGGIEFYPLPGDMLRTVHDKPQFSVIINGIPSKCSSNCSFTWLSSKTPVVNAINTSNPSLIRITGSGFDSSILSNNIVLIGSTPCTVVSGNRTTLNCVPGLGPIGTYTFKVKVIPNGNAIVNPSTTFTYSLKLFSFTPSVAGTGGGVILNLNGTGYSSQTIVRVDGNICLITSFTYNMISCIVPPNPTTIDKIVNVQVFDKNFTIIATQTFKYDFTNTPIVTNVSMSSKLDVNGGQIIRIDGFKFNSNIRQVYFSDIAVDIQSYTNFTIIISTPALKPGLYDLIIPSGSIGNARTNLKIEYSLFVSSFTPNVGSIRGGTNVRIYGGGFSTNCSLNSVFFGNIPCLIQNCSKTWIRCQTRYANKVYYIDNNGIHPNFGKGYAWSQSYLSINQGDYVTWSWDAPGAITNINYAVEQVADPNGFSLVVNGFTSRPSSSSGTFTYQFNTIGTFYYWSGYVDSSNSISFRGTIKVEPPIDRNLQLSVKVNNFEAQKCSFPFQYNSLNYSSCTNINSTFNWCSPTSIFNTQRLDCSIPNSMPIDTCPGSNLNLVGCSNSSITSVYDFKFTQCNAASVTSILPLNGSFGDIISIKGNRFSTVVCENIVLIGDYLCPIVTVSTTQITCKIGNNSGLIPNKEYNIEIQIKNVGNAIQNSIYKFRFLPKITSITPNIGSSEGSTVVTIVGDGFDTNSTTIQLAGKFYTQNNALITYNKIVINTNPTNSYAVELAVLVNNIKSICAVTPNCSYIFSSLIAPKLISIRPTNMSDSTTLSITGSKFGSTASPLSVFVGAQNCSIIRVNDSLILCNLTSLNIGPQSVNVILNNIGKATQPTIPLVVNGIPSIKSISPIVGSIYGGTLLTIIGNGFDSVSNTQVRIRNQTCTIESVSLSMIKCRTLASFIGIANVSISSNSVTFPNQNFLYNTAFTPLITNITPNSGTTGTVVVLDGQGFSMNLSDVNVLIGNVSCTVQNASNTQIRCITGANYAGTYPVLVNINGKGLANLNYTFKYNLLISSISPMQGSYGGGLIISINGSGFSPNSQITICSAKCSIVGQIDSNQLSCIIPERSYLTTDTNCQLAILNNNLLATGQFTYRSSLTASVTSVSPSRGGTGGGTVITISGNGFPVDKTQLQVTIAGTNCLIYSTTSTKIICTTDAYKNSSVTAPVRVLLKNVGNALTAVTATFTYVDLWSSIFTWGGKNVPQEGSLVVIGQQQTVYLDTVTPILKGLIIQGGSLICDDNQDVTLQAEYIIIADGGRFQCGTKSNPFKRKATIIMYGSLRSTELPIFGSKVLAVRNGTLDLHGLPVGVTWTYLATKAAAQTSSIVLNDSVKWPIGGKIVIATTGDYLSQGQSEFRIIKSISSDGKTITLDSPLKYDHLGEKRTVGGVDVYIRAEVGLLSRNVVFTAINDNSWNALRTANACPNGFNPGEFATMTCFLGRYGDEIGSDEFGATIMLSGLNMNRIGKEEVIGRLSNVELSHVGQSFRLGRYPIHFHMLGDSPSSFVSECAIYESFNRAVNIHATNYVTVERTVIYNINGGAFFLEDGIEIGNVFQNNLAIFVKTSSSLLNEDVTPAAFWATNPNNTFQHNAVAGCTHFGYWYRLLENPDGPSFTTNYCPRKIPLGRFYNNSVHSVGRFGLWIFPIYTPSISGGCRDTTGSVAKFEGLITYNNDKGAEWAQASNVEFRNFISFDQKSVSLDTKQIVFHADVNTPYSKNFYDDTVGPAVVDSIIIGNSLPSATSSITPIGLAISWDRGQIIKNVKFINFPTSIAISPTTITGICIYGCGGWTTKFSGLSFNNVQYKTVHRWPWDAIYEDLDGSLSGSPGSVIVSSTNITNNNSKCRKNSFYSNGVICSQTTDWIRFSFNNIKPDTAILLLIKDQYGRIDLCPKLKKSLTHQQSFTFSIEANQSYELNFDQVLHPTNMSYSGVFYGLKPNQYLIIKHNLLKKPDQVFLLGNALSKESLKPLTISANQNGDWYWENDTRTLSYIVHNRLGTFPFLDVPVNFLAQKCRYPNCVMPIQPSSKLPATKRATDAVFWSNETTWDIAVIKRASNNYAIALPIDGDVITIPDGLWVVVDIPLPKLTRIQIDGYLEFDDSIDNKLIADEIFINGGQLIAGWENDPFTHNLEIILTGTKADVEYILPNGFDSMGTKTIGVYGGLDLHGLPRSPCWTRIAQTAKAGSNSITLNEVVDWKVNEEIVLTTTSYSLYQTETFKITAVSSDRRTITLNNTLKYDHIAVQETFTNGKSYNISAGVGLLTKNIKIIGDEYNQQFKDLFGFRIIVTDYSNLMRLDDSNQTLSVYYKGYARLSNVELKNYGQFSRNDGEDYKYGILFSNLQLYDTKRPSYVKNCSFYNGFAAAIGILGSQSIPIERNIIHRALDISIRVISCHALIRYNLVAFTLWSSIFFPDQAAFDKRFLGAINIQESTFAIVEDNFIAGVHRIGLNYRGSLCPGIKPLSTVYTHSIKRNTIYGSLAGVVIFPGASYSSSCILISEFTIFKSFNLGLFYHGSSNVLIDSNIFIDNQLNMYPQIHSPPSATHEYNPNRRIDVRNNLIIGTSPSFNCNVDVADNDLNYQSSKLAQVFTARNNGKIGVVWASFISSQNSAPREPWIGSLSYSAINGLAYFDSNTFAYFRKSCNGSVDAVITSCKTIDDGQQPVQFRNTKFYSVENSSKVYLHRPNIEKINPGDCLDMDCDGMKKNLLTDLDGSFLGSPGTVISQSEYGWGSQQRGLGDFRIPKEAITDNNGNAKPMSSVYTYTGIVRDQNLCAYKDDWQAYECHGLDHRMMVIESMDADSESRRLSPVAIISDNKYIDLINGPQDHGWCQGYTCQKRLSTFLAIVAGNKSYDIYLSSTPPTRLRFRILNADASFKIRLSMYYSTPNNINVYKGNTLIDPTNADRSSGSLRLKDPGSNLNLYMPSINNPIGANFVNRQEKKVYFTIDGSIYYDLVVAPEIFVSFGTPSVTSTTFFNSANLVNNLASLLNVPPWMIVRVEIVKESSNNTRVVRQTSTQSQLVVVIGVDPPTNGDNDTNIQSNIDLIENISFNLSVKFYTGKLQTSAKSLGLDIISLNVQTTPLVPDSDVTVQLKQIGRLNKIQDASKCNAQSICQTQPIIQILDTNNQPMSISQAGNQLYLIATVKRSTKITRVIYQSKALIDSDGIAKFDNFGLSDESDGVVILYTLMAGSTTLSYTFEAQPIVVGKPVLDVIQVESETLVVNGTQFMANFYLADKLSKYKLPYPSWKNQTWNACISLYKLDKWTPDSAKLTPSTICSNLNTLANNTFVFKNLFINQIGVYLLNITARSSDGEYTINSFSNTIRVDSETDLNDTLVNDNKPNLYIIFNGTYIEANKEIIKALMFNFLKSFNLSITGSMNVYQGSLYVATYVQENPSGLTDLKNYLINRDVLTDYQFYSFTYNDDTYTTGRQAVITAGSLQSIPTNDKNTDNSATIGGVVGGILGAAVIVAVVIGGVFIYNKYKKSIKLSPEETLDPKTKSDERNNKYNENVNNGLEMNENLNEMRHPPRPMSVQSMAEIQGVKTPEDLFLGSENMRPTK